MYAKAAKIDKELAENADTCIVKCDFQTRRYRLCVGHNMGDSVVEVSSGSIERQRYSTVPQFQQN